MALSRKDSGMDINNLGQEEKDKLAELKQILKDKNILTERHEDQLLTRFLVARQWNLQKATQMIEDCEKWRVERKVDELMNFRYPEIKEISQLLPRYFHKTDKLGRPLFIMEFDKADGNKIFKVTTAERLLSHHIRTLEKVDNYYLRAAHLASPKSNRQIMTVVDLKGAYLSQFHQFARLIIDYFTIILNNYPDQLGALRIINAPFLFTAVWRVIKVVLDARTLSKIQILGGDYEGELKSLIDEENLPVRYGGTCICKDGCGHKDLGPWNDGSLANFPEEKWERLGEKDFMEE